MSVPKSGQKSSSNPNTAEFSSMTQQFSFFYLPKVRLQKYNVIPREMRSSVPEGTCTTLWLFYSRMPCDRCYSKTVGNFCAGGIVGNFLWWCSCWELLWRQVYLKPSDGDSAFVEAFVTFCWELFVSDFLELCTARQIWRFKRQSEQQIWNQNRFFGN